MNLTSFLLGVLKVKPHVPMIKFRKYKKDKVLGKKATDKVAKGSDSSSVGKANFSKATASVVIDDDRAVPNRFRRRAMSPEEIDSINCGGCPPDPPSKPKPQPKKKEVKKKK